MSGRLLGAVICMEALVRMFGLRVGEKEVGNKLGYKFLIQPTVSSRLNLKYGQRRKKIALNIIQAFQTTDVIQDPGGLKSSQIRHQLIGHGFGTNYIRQNQTFILKISDAWDNVPPLDVKLSLHEIGARLHEKSVICAYFLHNAMPSFLIDCPKTCILMRDHICLYATKL